MVCSSSMSKPRVIRSCVKKGRSLRFPKIFIKKQTWWSNDKTIIELGYRKISWFVSVSQINYLPQPSASANNWSARHWQITIFCSTSSNNCWILTKWTRQSWNSPFWGSQWGGCFDGWRVILTKFDGWRLNFRAFDGWKLLSRKLVQELK